MGVSPKTYLQLLTVERTAGILGVSAATVRNWVRCGRIVPAARAKRSAAGLGAVPSG